MKIIFKINNFENFLLFFLNFHSLKYIFPFFCPTRDGILYLYGMNPISSLFIFSKKKKKFIIQLIVLTLKNIFLII